MSAKGSHTTADYIAWHEAVSLITQLKNKPAKALLIAIGIYTGLRISDILDLKWEQIIDFQFEVHEQKTGKFRIVTIAPALRDIIIQYSKDKSGYVFVSRNGKRWTVQYINAELKRMVRRYQIPGRISTHSLRKTFGRHVWEVNGKSDQALIMLSKMFNHQSTEVTRIYLGIRQQEISNIYLNL